MRILFLCTAHNSLSQRLSLILSSPPHNHVISVELAVSPQLMVSACELFKPDLVLCSFLTKKVPEAIWKNYLTLIVHPGAPGDAGPSALDWVLCGDNGEIDDADSALAKLLCPTSDGLAINPRPVWAITVLQAIEEMDAGPVWAFDEFPIVVDGDTTVNKSVLYRGAVTRAAARAVVSALERIVQVASATSSGIHPGLEAPPSAAQLAVSTSAPFSGGKTHVRPLLKPSARSFNVDIHPADTIARLIRSADTQPGVLSKVFGGRSLFVYGGIVERNPIPAILWADRYPTRATPPPGAVIATRDRRAVLVATADGKGIWITHVRPPKPANDKRPGVNAKLPAVVGLQSVGLEDVLRGVKEWGLGGWEKKTGTLQQVWVEYESYSAPGTTSPVNVAYVYFDFYNGATSTSQCQLLLSAIRDVISCPPSPIRALVLMGGPSYYSNGIDLNTIEGSPDPAKESWENINAINDVVESVLFPEIAQKGIMAIAAIRGNVAAGGLALATCADVVLCAESAVLNPHYRGVGLFGSEYHTFTWWNRAGSAKAEKLARGMLPMSATEACDIGLVDYLVGGPESDPSEIERLVKKQVQELVTTPAGSSVFRCAPWARPPVPTNSGFPEGALHLDTVAATKASTLSSLSPALPVHRLNELSYMLLDFFHPVRSLRYHNRRTAFVRKIAPTATPIRFATHRRHVPGQTGDNLALDEEERNEFDAAPGWVPGEEWGWVDGGLAEHARLSRTRPIIKVDTLTCDGSVGSHPTDLSSSVGGTDMERLSSGAYSDDSRKSGESTPVSEWGQDRCVLTEKNLKEQDREVVIGKPTSLFPCYYEPETVRGGY